MAIHGQSNKFVFDFHGVKHGLIKKIEFNAIVYQGSRRNLCTNKLTNLGQELQQRMLALEIGQKAAKLTQRFKNRERNMRRIVNHGVLLNIAAK